MSQMETLRSTLCITLIAVFISCGFCCTEEQWTCKSGACIQLDELCDGPADCADESDETAEACIQQVCPDFSFRCAYGACVSKTAECNGINNCADGSDEASALCPNARTQNTKCLNEEFQCDTGECIDLEKVCDGHSDCQDQSDETVKECASSFCPHYGFRCGYGACVGMDKKCDGVADCRDGSDETFNLCGTTPPVRPPPTTIVTVKPPTSGTSTETTKKPPPKPPVQVGCIASDIPHSRLAYEQDDTKVIYPGDRVPEGVSITYKCDRGFIREGLQFNLCFKSAWEHKPEPQCIKYCSSKPLQGITFRTECEYNGAAVPCGDRIKPGTLAKIACRLKYKIPDRNPPDRLRCQEDGTWDYEPFRCEPICGEDLPRVQAFVIDGVDTNITEVPWHVGIYHNYRQSGVYRHHCGGTIINAKVIISAAHCFWDKANQMAYDKSLYIVGAGKYNREYDAPEPSAQFRNISSITIPDQFTGDEHNYQGDIAVLVLINYLQFSPYIAPVCIKWEKLADKAIGNNLYGRVAGWGIDETEKSSINLRSADMPTTSYAECKTAAGPYASAVTNDKFCVLNKHSEIVCQGDSGGGFTHKKTLSNTNVYFLWGVVSGGVPSGRKCRDYAFTSFTNIQYYERMIMDIEIANRPK